MSSFKESIRQLEEIKKTNIKDWHYHLFVDGLEKAFPIWAISKRAMIRANKDSTDKKVTLAGLIDDITDEIRQKNSTEGGAFYRNKTSNNKGRNKKDFKLNSNSKDNKKKYKHYNQTNPKHS